MKEENHEDSKLLKMAENRESSRVDRLQKLC